MANMFAIILTIATVITGICWCIKYFRLDQYTQQFQDNTECLWYQFAVKFLHQLNLIENCSSIFPILLLVFFVRSFIFEPFHIPSGSMMPTLLVGDFILVEKFSYNIKNPITQKTLIRTSDPKRGDVVVFKYPPNPCCNYIKRIVGLPGDLISYDPVNKILQIQPHYGYPHDCANTLPVIYNKVEPSIFFQLVQSSNQGETRNIFLPSPTNKQVQERRHLLQYEEILGNKLHNILIVPNHQEPLYMYYQQPGQKLAEWVVPQGKYFMMGDNRDNSADSRYWGFVPEENLVGKAKFIWMSFDKLEGQLPTGIRFNRIGYIK